METCEGIFFCQRILEFLAGEYVDRLQFANRAKIGVEDAILFMLQMCARA